VDSCYRESPFSVGDRIYALTHASLAFSGRNFARLDPNTSLDVVSLGDRRTQLALRDGSAMFEVGHLERNELFEVATPYGAVNFDQPGLYNLAFDNNGGVLVSVLSGLARVVGQSGSGEISKGEMLTLVGQAATELALSRLNNQDAGSQVDDYYRYQYPNSYDGRYNNYDAYLSDPYYYDPYRQNASYQYASRPFRASTIWITTATGRMWPAMAMPGDRESIQAGFPISRASGPMIIRMGQPGFQASPGATRPIIMGVGLTLITSGTGFPMA
jgi:hypothetical protein